MKLIKRARSIKAVFVTYLAAAAAAVVTSTMTADDVTTTPRTALTESQMPVSGASPSGGRRP